MELSLASFGLVRLGSAALFHTILELVDLCLFLGYFGDVGVADILRMCLFLVHELDLFLELRATVTNLFLERGNDSIFLCNGLFVRVHSLLHALCIPSALQRILPHCVDIFLQALDLIIAIFALISLLLLQLNNFLVLGGHRIFSNGQFLL